MQTFTSKSILVAAFVTLGANAVHTLPASAALTTTDAMASVRFLAGTWHCTGGGPDEDDTYTFEKNWWHDNDSTGAVTSGTYDAKRGKWIVFEMGPDGSYAVDEGTTTGSGSDELTLTTPYPAGNDKTYSFKKVSDTQYTLGKQTCTKK